MVADTELQCKCTVADVLMVSNTVFQIRIELHWGNISQYLR